MVECLRLSGYEPTVPLFIGSSRTYILANLRILEALRETLNTHAGRPRKQITAPRVYACSRSVINMEGWAVDFLEPRGQ